MLAVDGLPEETLRSVVDTLVRLVEAVTAIAPSFQELGKLAAVAAIRTALNFFLAREIREEREQVTDERAGAVHRSAASNGVAHATARKLATFGITSAARARTPDVPT